MPTTPPVYTLDLHFQGLANAIAAYLIPHRRGAALVECGPSTTLSALKEALVRHDLTPGDITDVLVTHIHLDHAGSSGWWARRGARIHVHNFGAPHMIDPTKLLNSAERIYGDEMDTLWGDVLPVPEEQINVLYDNDEIIIEDLNFTALDMPGHARHHMVYHFEDVCFTGDVGGIRIPRPGKVPHVRIPAVPPEFHLESWRESMERLSEIDFQRIAPTHFGIYDDVDAHLAAVMDGLDDLEAWMERVLTQDLSPDEVREKFFDWIEAQSEQTGLDDGRIASYEAAIPSFMSVDAMQRYWDKFRR
jgi:glyoxylase-like metal-dependent hydrolase (beta-lactamase superfamily II)